MPSRPKIAVLTVVLLLSAAALAGEATAPDPRRGPVGPDRPLGPPIHNRVLDLLDEEVFLDTAGEVHEWVSAPFDTSRFNRLLYRSTSEVENGVLLCTPEWQYTPDDAFLPGGPTPVFVGDDRDLRPTYPNGLPSSPILGLRARIRCELLPGPDLGTGDPPAASGTLADVKVLLRRE